jgi:transposase InsO family protein
VPCYLKDDLLRAAVEVSVGSGDSIKILPLKGIVDTGSSVTLVNAELARKILGNILWKDLIAGKSLDWNYKNRLLRTADNNVVSAICIPNVSFNYCGSIRQMDVYFSEGLPVPLLLGCDFIQLFKLVLDLSSKTLFIKKGNVDVDSSVIATTKVSVAGSDLLNKKFRVCVAGGSFSIPPRSEMLVRAKIMDLPRFYEGAHDAVFTFVPSTGLPSTVLGASGVVSVGKSVIPVRFLNMHSEPVTINKNLTIGFIEFCSRDTVYLVGEAGGPLDSVHNSGIQDFGDGQDCQGSSNKILSDADFLSLFDLDSDLCEFDSMQLKNLLCSYKRVFSLNKFDLGRFAGIRHEIRTTGPPIRQPLRRQNPVARVEANKLIQEMLDHDVIEPSSSPWASPIVLVKKSDGSTRFCVDYRLLNDVTYKDAYPLPRIDDTLDSLAGSKYFSTLDLTSGYWQITLAPGSSEKTAFSSAGGLYQFKYMPFGLTNAPATFQRAMEFCLSGLQWEQCLIYLDDVIVFSETFEDHLSRLANVFDRFEKNGLKLKPSKCTFLKKSVKYLGHIVSSEGVSPDPSKISAVDSWPTPKTVKDLRSFLGLASYYRRFVKDFSDLAAPLHQLTSTLVPFEWLDIHDKAFGDLKTRLVTAPVLAFPDFRKQFRLDTDASGVGVGAILTQVIDGRERVIAYASRTLNKQEKHYPITEKECLALVFGVKVFRPYLYGRSFSILSDHDPLCYLRKNKDLSGRLMRWLLKLEQYTYTVIHRPGKKHGNADALSRQPEPATGNCEIIPPDPVLALVGAGSPLESGFSNLDRFIECQHEDKHIFAIFRNLKFGTPITMDRVGLLRHFDLNRDSYCVRNEMVYFNSLLIVPPKLVSFVLSMCHDDSLSGHPGVKKTSALIKDRFFWHEMSKDITNYVTSCDSCQRRKRNYNKVYSPLSSMTAERPFQRWAMDVLQLPPSTLGYKYLLVATDYFTRWPVAFPMTNHTAETVAKIFFEKICCMYGVPESVHTDRGAEFQSRLLQELYKLLGVTSTRTTSYHPQGDGLVERLNQTIIETFSKVISNRSDWLDYLNPVLFAYRCSPQASLRCSPFEMLYGQKPKLPVDLQFDFSLGADIPNDGSVAALQRRLRSVRDHAVKNLFKAQADQRKYYNKNKSLGRPFSVGSSVLLQAILQGPNTKLDDRWLGPFRVVSFPHPGVVEIVHISNDRDRQVVAQDRLKRYVPRMTNCDAPEAVVVLDVPDDLGSSSSDDFSDSGGDSYVGSDVVCADYPSPVVHNVTSSPIVRACDDLDNLQKRFLEGSPPVIVSQSDGTSVAHVPDDSNVAVNNGENDSVSNVAVNNDENDSVSNVVVTNGENDSVIVIAPDVVNEYVEPTLRSTTGSDGGLESVLVDSSRSGIVVDRDIPPSSEVETSPLLRSTRSHRPPDRLNYSTLGGHSS